MSARHIPCISRLKDRARRLRDLTGQEMTHSQALEQVAHDLGLKDWNTAAALAPSEPDMGRFGVGDRIAGRYLSQPFMADIRVITPKAAGDGFRVTLHFDEPVDVVTSELFSAFRQRVTMEVDLTGQSQGATSDGVPHLVLDC